MLFEATPQYVGEAKLLDHFSQLSTNSDISTLLSSRNSPMIGGRPPFSPTPTCSSTGGDTFRSTCSASSFKVPEGTASNCEAVLRELRQAMRHRWPEEAAGHSERLGSVALKMPVMVQRQESIQAIVQESKQAMFQVGARHSAPSSLSLAPPQRMESAPAPAVTPASVYRSITSPQATPLLAPRTLRDMPRSPKGCGQQVLPSGRGQPITPKGCGQQVLPNGCGQPMSPKGSNQPVYHLVNTTHTYMVSMAPH